MLRTAVYVDYENMIYGGGYNLDFENLSFFLRANDLQLVRGTVYSAKDSHFESLNETIANKANTYWEALSRLGFFPYFKEIKRFPGGGAKANVDVDLAVDAILQAPNFDAVVLITGDGDFIHLVEALRFLGKRVYLISFLDPCRDLVSSADLFIPGLLYKELISDPDDEDHRNQDYYRGIVVRFDYERKYGFLRKPSGFLLHEFEDFFFHFTDFEEFLTQDLLYRMVQQKTVHEFKIVKEKDKQKEKAAHVREFRPPPRGPRGYLPLFK